GSGPISRQALEIIPAGRGEVSRPGSGRLLAEGHRRDRGAGRGPTPDDPCPPEPPPRPPHTRHPPPPDPALGPPPPPAAPPPAPSWPCCRARASISALTKNPAVSGSTFASASRRNTFRAQSQSRTPVPSSSRTTTL